MKIEAHCFAYNTSIEPLPDPFIFKDMEVHMDRHTSEGIHEVMLYITKKIKPETLKITDEEKNDTTGILVEQKMRPYKEDLTDVAHLIEGFLSLSYNIPAPKFETHRIIVGVKTESDEEEKMITEGKISSGFGNIKQPFRPHYYKWSEKIAEAFKTGEKHIPALSFFSQAVRAEDNNDQEVAFFLYFRIIDGYFSQGKQNVEKFLLKNKNGIAKYINYNEDIKNSLKNILNSLGLRSKSNTNFSGLISDLVLLRHKLTHFSERDSGSHHNAGLIFDLQVINFYLKNACALLLIDKTNLKL